MWGLTNHVNVGLSALWAYPEEDHAGSATGCLRRLWVKCPRASASLCQCLTNPTCLSV